MVGIMLYLLPDSKAVSKKLTLESENENTPDLAPIDAH